MKRKTLKIRRKKRSKGPQGSKGPHSQKTDEEQLQEAKARHKDKAMNRKKDKAQRNKGPVMQVIMQPRKKEAEPVYFNWSQPMQDGLIPSEREKGEAKDKKENDKKNENKKDKKETLHIPPKTTHANCSGVKGLHHLGDLPPHLVSLECAFCPDLEELPQEWPDTLRILDLRGCTKIREILGKLPEGLEKLLCSGCRLVSMPQIPYSVIELDCDDARWVYLINQRRQIRESLQEVNSAIANLSI